MKAKTTLRLGKFDVPRRLVPKAHVRAVEATLEQLSESTQGVLRIRFSTKRQKAWAHTLREIARNTPGLQFIYLNLGETTAVLVAVEQNKERQFKAAYL